LENGTLDAQRGPLAPAVAGPATPTAVATAARGPVRAASAAGVATSPAPVTTATTTIGNLKWYMTGPSSTKCHTKATPGATSTEDPTRAVEWARELASAVGLVSEAIGAPRPAG
jgi:hypothetical protein